MKYIISLICCMLSSYIYVELFHPIYDSQTLEEAFEIRGRVIETQEYAKSFKMSVEEERIIDQLSKEYDINKICTSEITYCGSGLLYSDEILELQNQEQIAVLKWIGTKEFEQYNQNINYIDNSIATKNFEEVILEEKFSDYIVNIEQIYSLSNIIILLQENPTETLINASFKYATTQNHQTNGYIDGLNTFLTNKKTKEEKKVKIIDTIPLLSYINFVNERENRYYEKINSRIEYYLHLATNSSVRRYHKMDPENDKTILELGSTTKSLYDKNVNRWLKELFDFTPMEGIYSDQDGSPEYKNIEHEPVFCYRDICEAQYHDEYVQEIYEFIE